MRIAPKIHSGSVFCAPAVNVVTITSSNDSANASSAPAMSAVESVGSVTKRKVCNGVRAEVGGRLDQRRRRAPQPREHVVVDHDDAERRVADDDRHQRQVDVVEAEERLQRDTGDDARAARAAARAGARRPRARRSGSGAPRTPPPIRASARCTVAASPAFTESHSASRTCWSCHATENQLVV